MLGSRQVKHNVLAEVVTFDPISRDGHDRRFTIPVGDEDALVDRLGRLLGDEGLRGRMGARGRERAEREFPLSRTVRRYEELFTWVAARR